MNSLKRRDSIRESFALNYPQNANGCKNILLIDNAVKDAQLFASSVNDNTFPIIYSRTSNKTDLLLILRTKFTSIERIGFAFASSNSGNSKPFLDSKPFFSSKEETGLYSENVEFIINIINEFQIKNIDYLACDTLNYSNWVNYYHILTKETGVVIGASNNKTGNIKFGGDWVMESTSQDIELIYFTKSIEYYSYLLDIPIWTNNILNTPPGIAIDSTNTYMYVTNYGSNTISQILISNPSTYNATWATSTQGLNGPIGIAIDSTNTYMYVTNYNINTISQILISNPSTYNATWATSTQGLNGPKGIAIDSTNTYMYVTNSNINTISRLDLPYLPPPTPDPIISDICFPAGTPIKTDQGIIAIEKIKPNMHTINKKLIIAITKTISPDNFLIEILKNGLGFNYPTHNTTMSQYHKVFFQGKMCEANAFLDKFGVIKVKYTGEILYNVLMEDHSRISVNNLICETLHPDNIVAKLYTKNQTKNEIYDKIVVLLKEKSNKKNIKANNRYSSLRKFNL